MQLKNFVLNKDASLAEALKKIDKNSAGFILVESKTRIIGVVTDGDIRRELLAGTILEDKIEKCVNLDFIYAIEGDTRESIIKHLDSEIKFIPLLDKEFKLLKILTKKDFPIDAEKLSFARARAPVRISFGGGGSDVTNFFSKNVGAVINATIYCYSHAVLKKRIDQQIIVRSSDLDEVVLENLKWPALLRILLIHSQEKYEVFFEIGEIDESRLSVRLSRRNFFSQVGPPALIPIKLIKLLEKMASKTYVPESEASRLKGAGAGLTDND